MQGPLSDAELDALRQIDTATIANAIEHFDIRSNTDGFMGWDIRCMFPEMGVMVGYAVTGTLDTTTHGRVHDREARFHLFEAIDASPKPVVLALKDLSSKAKAWLPLRRRIGNRINATWRNRACHGRRRARCGQLYATWASTTSRPAWFRRTATSASWRRRCRCESAACW